MDISALTQIESNTIQALGEQKLYDKTTDNKSQDLFGTFFQSAVQSINQTNDYANAAAEEKLKLALGETESTHDLTIALEKSSTALQYTVAIRDAFMDAYKEILNMQI